MAKKIIEKTEEVQATKYQVTIIYESVNSKKNNKERRVQAKRYKIYNEEFDPGSG